VLALALGAAWLARPRNPEPARSDEGAPRVERTLPAAAAEPGAPPAGTRPAPAPEERRSAPGGTVRVEGIVVDPEGSPVAGATIEVADSDLDPARPAATSGDDGRFAFETALESPRVAARAPGHAPEALVPARPDSHGRIFVRLRLSARGGCVSGRVLLPDGAPAAGARVRIASPRIPRLLENGESGLLPVVETTADASGRFVAEGVAPGDVGLVASAPGLAGARRTVYVVEDRVASVDLGLEPGAIVFGTVTAADGHAVRGATIVARDADGRGSEFDRLASTDERGAYLLPDVAARDIVLSASAVPRLSAERPLAIEAGSTIEWSPVLEAPGAAIEGRVVAEDGGSSAEGLAVLFTPEGRPREWLARTETDRVGRFRLQGCPENLRGDVVVIEGDPSRALPLAIASGVESGGTGDVVVPLPADRAVEAFVRGAIFDDAGRAAGAARVIVFRSDGLFTFGDASEGTGEFRIGPLRPGPHRLEVRGRMGVPLPLREFEVAGPGEIDVGRLVIPAPGFLCLSLSPSDAIGVGHVQYWIVFEDGAPGIKGPYGGDPPPRIALDPGDYRVLVQGPMISAASAPFLVDSGSETSVSLPLESGLVRTIEIVEPWQEEDSSSATVTIEDADGVVLETLEIARSLATQTLSAEHRFSKPGLHRLRARTDSGRTGETSFIAEPSARGHRLAIPVE